MGEDVCVCVCVHGGGGRGIWVCGGEVHICDRLPHCSTLVAIYLFYKSVEAKLINQHESCHLLPLFLGLWV